MPATDKSDVLTSQHIGSLNAVIAQTDKSLKVLETKAKQGIEYFKASFADLNKQKAGLVGRIEKLKGGVGQLPRGDSSFTTLVKDLTTYAKDVESESKKQPIQTYYFGKSKVSSSAALESKIKGVLPDKSKNNASQALNAVLAGELKDASKAGSGVKHASAGKTGVSSCTLFCTLEEENKGLETILTIVAVGSHADSKSYDIHWSSISKLKEGQVFTL